MGSHLGAIGFPNDPDVPLEALVRRVVDAGHQLGESIDGKVRLVAYDDASGSRTTVVLEREEIVCLTPSFRPGSLLSVSVGSLAPNDCPFERPLLVDVYGDDGADCYPLALQLDDLALGADRYSAGSRAVVEVVALAEGIQVFADEEAHRASGTPMGPRSLIPSGTFAVPGSPGEADFVVSPRILMRGVVTSSELRHHPLLGGAFVRLTVSSHCADYEVLVQASDLAHASGNVVLPPPRSIVSGQFWLSGRLNA